MISNDMQETYVRPAMMYRAETWVARKVRETKSNVVEI